MSATDAPATGARAPVSAPPSPSAGGRGTRSRGARLAPYLFVSPSLLLLLVFSFVPIVAAVVLSFQEVAVFGQGTWVGAANYGRMVGDPLFWTSIQNTAVFTVGTVPTSMAVGLLLAVLLNRAMPGRALIRALFFLPMIAAGVVVAVVMAWIFNGDYGVVDNLLAALGLPRVPWLTSPQVAMLTFVLAVVWTRIGFCMVIYLGALQAVPVELVEAMTVDGAGRWTRFRSLVWPLLRPTTFVLLVVNVVFSLQVFDIVYVLTGGGPGFATTVLIQYIFRTAFTNGEMGYASAIGVVFALILLAFTALQWRANRRAEDVA
jgi:multiple sugar transport system permease protein